MTSEHRENTMRLVSQHRRLSRKRLFSNYKRPNPISTGRFSYLAHDLNASHLPSFTFLDLFLFCFERHWGILDIKTQCREGVSIYSISYLLTCSHHASPHPILVLFGAHTQ